MAISIKKSFDNNAIRTYCDKYMRTVKDNVIMVFIEGATLVVDDARENANFMNHTYNLRSSMGMVVAENGTAIIQNFKTLEGGTKGTLKAKNLTEENIPAKGISTVVVAAEDYALSVEAKNKSVLTSSVYLFNNTIKKYMK